MPTPRPEPTLDPVTLRGSYDTQLRTWLPAQPPAGATVTHDGPLIRFTEPGQWGLLTYRDLGGLEGDQLDQLIMRQRDHFAARGESVEWKLHGHDRPADLPVRLRAAGFTPDDEETVVVGLAAPLAEAVPTIPPGVRLRRVTARADLDRIAELETTVWGEERGRLADGLENELAADPDGTTVVVAEADGRVICAGWVRYAAGTEFATLWGGSTLPGWRGRGVYRALVAHRARLATDRGYTYLQVDASSESAPILRRLGFVAITTTTPYVFTPTVGVTG